MTDLEKLQAADKILAGSKINIDELIDEIVEEEEEEEEEEESENPMYDSETEHLLCYNERL